MSKHHISARNDFGISAPILQKHRGFNGMHKCAKQHQRKRGCLTKKGEIALKICTQKATKVWKLSGFCGIIDV